jgi:hypothetical protein
VGKERSEARRKKDNKQAGERKEKTSIQKHKTGKKKKKKTGIYTTRETNETEQTLHKPQTEDEREREREREKQ